jgi:DNA end-binding protein Ku
MKSITYKDASCYDSTMCNLVVYEHGVLLHTMYFSNEIRHVPQFGVIEAVDLKPQEVKLTEQLIKTMTEPFKPNKYHDEFEDKLRKLIEAKQHGKTIEIGKEPARSTVIDIKAALRKSLAALSSTSKEKKKSNGKINRAEQTGA